MVFIGNPRRGTNRGRGRSDHPKIHAEQATSTTDLWHPINQNQNRGCRCGRSTRLHPKLFPPQGCPSTAHPSSTPTAVGARTRCSGRWRRRPWPCMGIGGDPSSGSQDMWPILSDRKELSNIEGEHVINFGQCFARAIIAEVKRSTRQVLGKAGLFGA